MHRRSPRSGLSVVALVLALVGLAAAPGGATAATDPDGRYRGSLVADDVADSGTVLFDVASHGKRILRWRVTMNVTCATYPVEVELITQTMPTIKVGANGRFRSVYTTPTAKADEVRIVVSGRLEGRRVTGGKIDYDVHFSTGRCLRKADWAARPRS